MKYNQLFRFVLKGGTKSPQMVAIKLFAKIKKFNQEE
jgi:hypothetical protein